MTRTITVNHQTHTETEHPGDIARLPFRTYSDLPCYRYVSTLDTRAAIVEAVATCPPCHRYGVAARARRWAKECATLARRRNDPEQHGAWRHLEGFADGICQSLIYGW